MKFFKKIPGICKRILKAAFNRVKTFVVSCYNHAEAVVILTLAAMGLNALLSEIPFMITVPLWLEASMVIPVIAVFGILALLKSSDMRHVRRNQKLVTV